MLVKCQEANAAVSECLRMMYSCDCWIDASTASRIGTLGMLFLRRYQGLAHEALRQGRSLFPIYPKAHAFHRVMLNLLRGPRTGFEVESPLNYAAAPDEDFIGRPSRVSTVGKLQAKMC